MLSTTALIYVGWPVDSEDASKFKKLRDDNKLPSGIMINQFDCGPDSAPHEYICTMFTTMRSSNPHDNQTSLSSGEIIDAMTRGHHMLTVYNFAPPKLWIHTFTTYL